MSDFNGIKHRLKLRWRLIAASSLVVVIFVALMTGYTYPLLLLFAAIGVAALMLILSDFVSVKTEHYQPHDLMTSLNKIPYAVAILSAKGKLLWRTELFAETLAPDDKAIFNLSRQNATLATTLFRLLGSNKKSLTSEAIALSRENDSAYIFATHHVSGNQNQDFKLLTLEAPKKSGLFASEAINLCDALPMPAGIVDENGDIVRLNAIFSKTYNIPEGTNIGTPLRKLAHGLPNDISNQSAAPQGPFSVQIGKSQANASFISIGLNQNLFVFDAEAFSSFNTQNQFEKAILTAPIPMALVSVRGEVIAENDAFMEIPGLTQALQDGRQMMIWELMEQASATVFQDYLKKLRSQKVSNFDETIVMKDDVGLPWRLLAQPHTSKDTLLVTLIQGSPHILMDEKTVQSQKMQAVGELAGGIAHDFNNLLTAIIGFSDLLLTRFRAFDPAFKDVMNIKNNATRAADLVRHILAYSRRQTLRPTMLAITDVIEDFNASVGRILGEKVKAKIEHGRDLWFVKADEGQLFQVVMNLAVNARDAMPEGGDITIRTCNISERDSLNYKARGIERGEYILCEVRDTGTGIRAEHLAKIFDPFFSTKDVGKGTGLGLSTVYGIVKQTGGTILVDSVLGQGTAFLIFLPRYLETEDDLKVLRTKAEPKTETRDLTGCETILLVEDEDAVRSFASRALSTRGYTVLEATTGVEALEVMERSEVNIDLIVSDVVMPEMDGPTLLGHVRKMKPGIRFVFMSGYAEEAFRKNLGDEEDFFFLPKPFTLKKLAETVKAATTS